MSARSIILASATTLSLLGLSACGWIDEVGSDSASEADRAGTTAAPAPSTSGATASTTAEPAESASADTSPSEGATAAAPAQEGVIIVRLTGQNEVPPNPSSGIGQAQVAYDPATRTLSWNVSYRGLSGVPRAAHFHGPAAEGENAGVQVPIAEGLMASPLVGSTRITEQQAAELLAGRWYINIHSTTYPNGEIRGQVEPAGAM